MKTFADLGVKVKQRADTYQRYVPTERDEVHATPVTYEVPIICDPYTPRPLGWSFHPYRLK